MLLIEQYRGLDEHGKKIVEYILEIEFKRAEELRNSLKKLLFTYEEKLSKIPGNNSHDKALTTAASTPNSPEITCTCNDTVEPHEEL